MDLLRSTWDVMGALGTHAWSRALPMPGAPEGKTVGETFDSTIAVRIEPGSDAISQRALTGATKAGAAALTGAEGARLVDVLRAALGTYDGRKGLANVQGIILADTVEGAALATGAAYANVLNDMGIRKLVPAAQATRSTVKDAVGALRIGAVRATFSGFAPDWIILSPKAALPLLELAREGAANLSVDQAADAARALAVLRHEIAHTIEPVSDPSKAFRGQLTKPFGFPLNKALTLSRMGWLAERGLLDKLERGAVSPTLWLEESIADLESMDHREAGTLLGRVGLAASERNLSQFAAGYPPYKQQVDRLLTLAGIDRTTEAGLAAARELLQTRALAAVPRAFADALVVANGKPAALAPRIAELIEAAGVGVTLGSRDLPPSFRAKIDEVEKLLRG